MFGRKASGKDVLAERVRALGEGRPPVAASPAAAPAVHGYKPPAGPVASVARSTRQQERAPREPLFRTGTILTPGGGHQNVAVKDLSATGARIEFHTRGELPPVMVLIEPTLKLRKRCRVIWQDNGCAGLEFIAEQGA